jgi:uncharacterized tellurite resistance protein B-like protein
MLFGRNSKEPAPGGTEQLQRAVKAHLPGADAETQEIVASVAGLLAGVAYADRQYSAAEQARVREALGAVDGLSAAGADAICVLLRDHVVAIATINPQAYTRSLRELADVALRREVLDLLVDLAAADGEIAFAETELLRRTTAALGLSQDDYLAAQARHKDKLQALR